MQWIRDGCSCILRNEQLYMPKYKLWYLRSTISSTFSFNSKCQYKCILCLNGWILFFSKLCHYKFRQKYGRVEKQQTPRSSKEYKGLTLELTINNIKLYVQHIPFKWNPCSILNYGLVFVLVVCYGCMYIKI